MTVRRLPIARREERQQKVVGGCVGSSGCDKLVGFDGKGRRDPWPQILPVSLNSRKITVAKVSVVVYEINSAARNERQKLIELCGVSDLLFLVGMLCRSGGQAEARGRTGDRLRWMLTTPHTHWNFRNEGNKSCPAGAHYYY